MIPPIPSEPYLVLSKIFNISILLFLSEKDKQAATIAGSNACIFILFGLDAKLAPD